MRKWNVLLVSALVLCCSLLPALAADSPAVLGILEIRGLDSLASSAFELSKAGGSPMPKEMLSLMLYGALGSMPGMGIQAEGTVRALAFDGDADQGSVALLLPVENEGADYLANLGKAEWKNEAETADGILHFTPPEGSGVAWSEVYFLKRGDTLLAGETAEDVRKADAAMASLPAILPVEGDVALQVRPAALVDQFAPQIAEGMDQAFRAPGMPPEAAAMGQLYMKVYLAVARQLDEFAVGLGVANGNLNIHTRVAPVAGSLFDQWFQTVGSPSAAAAVVALPEALFAETAHIGDMNVLAPAYFRYVDELMAIMPAQPGADAMKTYMETAKSYWQQMGGDFGIALLPPTEESPLRLAEFISLKDSAAARTTTQQLVKNANEMIQSLFSATNNPMMPFQVELASGEPREYREIAVDKLSYGLKMGDEMAANWPKGIPMKFDIELAWVPGGVLATIGDAALTDALVDRALDGAAAPLSELPAWKAAYPAPEPKLADMTHFALFDTIRAYLGLVDSHTGGELAGNIPDGPGNLESASYMAMGGMMSRVRFSLADIGAIGLKIKEAQEKAMAEMMKQMESQGEMQFSDDGEFAPPEEGNEGFDADEAEEEAEEEEVEVPSVVEETPAPAPAATE